MFTSLVVTIVVWMLTLRLSSSASLNLSMTASDLTQMSIFADEYWNDTIKGAVVPFVKSSEDTAFGATITGFAHASDLTSRVGSHRRENDVLTLLGKQPHLCELAKNYTSDEARPIVSQ